MFTFMEFPKTTKEVMVKINSEAENFESLYIRFLDNELKDSFMRGVNVIDRWMDNDGWHEFASTKYDQIEQDHEDVSFGGFGHHEDIVITIEKDRYIVGFTKFD